MQTITLNTPSFQGDVLAVNNEPCGAAGVGGFDLYDVSDPANPKPLVQGYGDRSPDHAAGRGQGPDDAGPGRDPEQRRLDLHLAGRPEGLRGRPSTTLEFADLDIFDITDPKNPEFIADLDLDELAIDQGVDVVDVQGRSRTDDVIFLHDMVVKQINGLPIMLASYWDIGLRQARRLRPGQSPDPRGLGVRRRGPADGHPGHRRSAGRPAEGNAPSGEFSHDNRYVLAADEDFTPYRVLLGQVETSEDDIFNFFTVGLPDAGPAGHEGAAPIDGDSRFVGDALHRGRNPAGHSRRSTSPSSSAAAATSRRRCRTPTRAATTA